MRFFFSGPRIFGVRPGISLGPEDFKGSAKSGWVHAHELGSSERNQTPRPQADTGGFVYVVKGDHNLIKLGVSTNPNARLAQLRTASPFPIDFAYVCAVQGPATEAFALEADAHAILQSQRLSGEWFDIPPDMAVAAIAAAAHRAGRRYVEIAPENIAAVIQSARSEPQAVQAPTSQPVGMPARISLMVLATATAAFGSTFAGWGIGLSLLATLTTAFIAMIWIAVT